MLFADFVNTFFRYFIKLSINAGTRPIGSLQIPLAF